MAIRIVRLGSPREPGEGTRLGTVRHPPRGVRRADYARKDYFDIWIPELAPSARLLAWARAGRLVDQRWATFARRYRREMARPACRQLISLLAALSASSDFSVGCYCEDERHCHRWLLRELLEESGATIV
jgi:uncharacterized protein YeaO (DUF488 family)